MWMSNKKTWLSWSFHGIKHAVKSKQVSHEPRPKRETLCQWVLENDCWPFVGLMPTLEPIPGLRNSYQSLTGQPESHASASSRSSMTCSPFRLIGRRQGLILWQNEARHTEKRSWATPKGARWEPAAFPRFPSSDLYGNHPRGHY